MTGTGGSGFETVSSPERIDACAGALIALRGATEELRADLDETRGRKLVWREERDTISGRTKHQVDWNPALEYLLGPELTASMPALAKGACGAVPHGKGTLLKLADDPRQMTTPESIERIEQCKRELGEHRFFVKNPELEEDGERIELNLTGAPLPARRSGDGSK